MRFTNRILNRVKKSLGYIPVDYDNSNNMGDMLSPYLIKYYTKKRTYCNNNVNTFRYSVCGSILGRQDSKSIILGSGFMFEDEFIYSEPMDVLCVRGPLTSDRLKMLGIKTTNNYGDPAILLKNIYQFKNNHKYEIGIIPHYADQELLSQIKIDKAIIINIKHPIYRIIREINQCKLILSSSLHGLILEDTYNIPSIRIKSNNVYGGDFKFIDYRLGIGGKPHYCIDIGILLSKSFKWEYILSKATKYSTDESSRNVEEIFRNL